MAFPLNMILPIGTRRSGQPLTSKNLYLRAHDTGNPETTAQTNVNYYKNTYMIDWSIVASAHIFVDDKECIVCIPVTEKHGTFYTIHRQTINGITCK